MAGKDITFGEMFALQQQLQDAHPQWGGYFPERGKESLLWTFEEMGEVVAIFKKKGPQQIMSDPEVRSCFLEETADVLMFLCDMLRCMDVQPEEIAGAFRGKFDYNMHRDWSSQNQQLFSHSHLSSDSDQTKSSADEKER